MSTYTDTLETKNAVLDLALDGDDVDVVTREHDESGPVVRLPLPVLTGFVDGLNDQHDRAAGADVDSPPAAIERKANSPSREVLEAALKAALESETEATTSAEAAKDTPRLVQQQRDQAQRAAQTLGKVIEDQCRDIARITRSEHMVDEDGDADWEAIWSRGHDMAERLEKAETAVDDLREQVALAVREKDEWETNAEEANRRAAQPRPSTPEDITESMCTRAADEFERTQSWEAALTAALTEPSAEDPGVVAIAKVLRDFAVADEHNGTRDDMQFARLLHGRGVRSTTANADVLADDLAAHADTMLPYTDASRADWLISRGWRKADQ